MAHSSLGMPELPGAPGAEMMREGFGAAPGRKRAMEPLPMVGAALASNQKLYMVPQRSALAVESLPVGAAQTPGPVLVQNEPV